VSLSLPTCLSIFFFMLRLGFFLVPVPYLVHTLWQPARKCGFAYSARSDYPSLFRLPWRPSIASIASRLCIAALVQSPSHTSGQLSRGWRAYTGCLRHTRAPCTTTIISSAPPLRLGGMERCSSVLLDFQRMQVASSRAATISSGHAQPAALTCTPPIFMSCRPHGGAGGQGTQGEARCTE
jgi:hypothetical protein